MSMCYSPDHNNQDKVKSVIEHIIRLQDYVTHIQGLNITAAEFAYLKTLVLFAPGMDEMLTTFSKFLTILCFSPFILKT